MNSNDEIRLTAATDMLPEMFEYFERAKAVRELVYISGAHICLKDMLPDGRVCQTYEIPISDCKSVVGMLRLIFHLQEKIWVDEQLLRRFAKVACEACGWGAADEMPWAD